MRQESLEQRIGRLERTLLRLRLTCLSVALLFAAGLVLGLNQAPKSPTTRPAPRNLVARQVTIVDDRGTVRMILGQDAKDTQRRSRASGLTIFDAKGDERGGFGTMEDGSAVLAIDVPLGAGNDMRDRVGMMVRPDGGAMFLLMDADAQPAVRLQSDAKSGGSVEVFKCDKASSKIQVRGLHADGDKTETVDLNDGG